MFTISKDNYEGSTKIINKELHNVGGIMMGSLYVTCERVDANLDNGYLSINLYIDDEDFINTTYNPKGLKVADIGIDTEKGESLKVEINTDMDALEFSLLAE